MNFVNKWNKQWEERLKVGDLHGWKKISEREVEKKNNEIRTHLESENV